MKILTSSSLLVALATGVLVLESAAPDSRASEPSAAAKELTADPVHSFIHFRCKHMDTSWAVGRFNDFSGTFTFDPEDLAASEIDFTVETASVDTGSEKRDQHLKSPDFFSVEQFPQMQFTSESIEKAGEDTYDLTGTLEWMGREKQIEAELEHLGQGTMQGTEIHGFQTEFAIERSDFGVDYGIPDQLGDKVHVTINVEARAKG